MPRHAARRRHADVRRAAARRQPLSTTARSALRGYRQATFLAVALTSLLLLMLGAQGTDANQPANSSEPATSSRGEAASDDGSAAGQTPGRQEPGEQEPDAEPEAEPADPQRSLEEATTTVQRLFQGLLALLPKVTVALLLLVLAWLFSALLRWLLRRLLSRWEKGEAVSALARLALFLLAIGAGLSVISGDATALLGSVGLVGLALSWALQTPIESFTGWVLNAFRGYYRPGDRIEVGDVFGDVYRIDMLSTTVWESGGPGKAVSGAQPTGALVTFPNWEILRSNIINYSRDFPYVWDEVTFAVANESDLDYTVDVLRRAADGVVGEMMREPATRYQKLLERERLSYGVEPHPQIYLTLSDMWTNCTVRYLVPLRERRKWSSELILALSRELARAEHQPRILPGYPLTQVDMRERREETGGDAEQP